MKLLTFLIFMVGTISVAPCQWEIENSHTTANLRGIHNVGGGVAWASGTSGTVLRTKDGGHLWQTCAIPLAGTKDGAEGLDFRGVQAFDENTAVVMSSGPGDQSRLYKTSDGCQTWKLLLTNPDKDGYWDAIQFDGTKHGLLLGDPVNGLFAMFATWDGGATWGKVQAPGLSANPDKESVFAASNSSLVLFGQSHQFFVTGGPGGAYFFYCARALEAGIDRSLAKCSQAPQRLPLAIPSVSAGAFSMAVGSKGFVIVGGDYLRPDSDLGTAAYGMPSDNVEWHTAQTRPHGFRSAVALEEKTRTWITIGPNGTDISTDGAHNWHPLTPTPQDDPGADKNWNALSLPFVVGPKGRIGKLRSGALKH